MFYSFGKDCTTKNGNKINPACSELKQQKKTHTKTNSNQKQESPTRVEGRASRYNTAAGIVEMTTQHYLCYLDRSNCKIVEEVVPFGFFKNR